MLCYKELSNKKSIEKSSENIYRYYQTVVYFIHLEALSHIEFIVQHLLYSHSAIGCFHVIFFSLGVIILYDWSYLAVLWNAKYRAKT